MFKISVITNIPPGKPFQRLLKQKVEEKLMEWIRNEFREHRLEVDVYIERSDEVNGLGIKIEYDTTSVPQDHRLRFFPIRLS